MRVAILHRQCHTRTDASCCGLQGQMIIAVDDWNTSMKLASVRGRGGVLQASEGAPLWLMTGASVSACCASELDEVQQW